MTARARRVLDKVVRRIDDVSPPGLGRWAPAWDLISEPSDRFLDALSQWEGEDSPGTRATLQRAADSFVRSWRAAASQWEQAGRPLDHSTKDLTLEQVAP